MDSILTPNESNGSTLSGNQNYNRITSLFNSKGVTLFECFVGVKIIDFPQIQFWLPTNSERPFQNVTLSKEIYIPKKIICNVYKNHTTTVTKKKIPWASPFNQTWRHSHETLTRKRHNALLLLLLPGAPWHISQLGPLHLLLGSGAGFNRRRRRRWRGALGVEEPLLRPF